MQKKISILILLAFLSACATPYQEDGFRGGVSNLQVGETVWEIDARGNAYTSEKKVRDFVLLKASEMGRANGFSHFYLFDKDKKTDTDSFSWTDYYSGITNTFNYDKPKQSISIKFYKEGEELPETAYSVEIIYNQLSSIYLN